MNHTRITRIGDGFVEGVSHNPEISKQVLLRAGLINHLQQLAVATLHPDQQTMKHIHEDLDEVFVVLSGTGVAEIDGQQCALTIGNCVHIPPGCLHSFKNDGQGALVLLYFGIDGGQKISG